MLHHITSYHITSYSITSYYIISYCTILYHIILHHIKLNHAHNKSLHKISHHRKRTILYHIILYYTTACAYHNISNDLLCRIELHHSISHHIIEHYVASYRITSHNITPPYYTTIVHLISFDLIILRCTISNHIMSYVKSCHIMRYQIILCHIASYEAIFILSEQVTEHQIIARCISLHYSILCAIACKLHIRSRDFRMVNYFDDINS